MGSKDRTAGSTADKCHANLLIALQLLLPEDLSRPEYIVLFIDVIAVCLPICLPNDVRHIVSPQQATLQVGANTTSIQSLGVRANCSCA